MCVLIQVYNRFKRHNRLINHNTDIVVQTVIRIKGVKLWSRQLTHNCYHQILPCGACSGLLDCQLFLIYIKPWDASPLVLRNPHPLLCIYHYL